MVFVENVLRNIIPKWIFRVIRVMMKSLALFCAITVSVLLSEPSFANENIDGSKGPLQSVTLQLKWKHQFQFAGYYAALEKGFYREAGLDVKILEIEEGEESTDKVIEGRADFGIAMSDLILHRAKGQPVVALAAIFQHSPLVILTPKTREIENIHAIKGKRLGMEAHSAELVAYLENEGISIEEIELLSHDFSVSNLISGNVDAISAYATDEPFLLLNQGIEYSTFSPRAGGIDFYGDTLFTSKTQIKEHPERVAAFLAASLKGWHYALENSDDIIELILKKYTQRHSREHLLFEAQHSKTLIMADVVQLGYMHTGRWNHIAQTYANLGMLDKNFSLDGFLYAPDSDADYGRLIQILGILFVVCLLLGVGVSVLIFSNRKLAVEVKERKRAEASLVESESRYRTLFDFNPIQTVVVGNDGKITMFNFAKKTSAERVPSVGDIMYKDYADKHEIDMHKELMACIQNGNNKEFAELKYKERYLNIRISAFAGGAIITSEDVTERKRLQSLLEQVRKMESVGTLSGGIAHEFNNILGIILGNTELAMDDIPKDFPTYEFLLEVKNASIRGKKVVQQLLSFSHKADHEKQPIDISRVVRESMEILRNSIPNSIEFDEILADDCQIVMGDRTQIHQLMINLCNNAAHSMEDTGGTIKIILGNQRISENRHFAGQTLYPGEYVRLVIEDIGKGIPSNIIDNIFDPFFTTKSMAESSGMGLAVVYGIVKAHDGFIEIESNSKKGTKVLCYFPVTDQKPMVPFFRT